MQRNKNLSKRSASQTGRQVIRRERKPKNSNPVLVAKVLDTFQLSDFIEMAAAGRPYPDDPTIDDTPLDLPYTITASAIEDSRARSQADAAARDATVERVLEHPRFQALRGSALCASLRDHAFERSVARSNFASFLSNTAQLFDSLADRQPFDINVSTSTFLPVGEINGRFVFAWSAMQANPVPALFQRLVSLLGDADPVRIRRCAFEGCRRVFYARRKDSKCCPAPAPCNNRRLQREWYQNHGKAAKYKQGSTER